MKSTLEQHPLINFRENMRSFSLAFAAFVAMVPSMGFSQTITFEDVNPGTTGSFSSSGFDFNMDGSQARVIRGPSCSPSCPDNGTTTVLSPYGPSTVTMTKSGGGAFALSNFDGAGSFNFNESHFPTYIPKQIDVTGFLAGGGSVVQSFLIDNSRISGPLNFTNYTFNSSFSNLASVSFSSSGAEGSIGFNGFTLDNIAVSAVPEPESFALLLAGLGSLGAVVRRRKAKQA